MSQPPEETPRWQTYPGDAGAGTPGLPVPAEPAGPPAQRPPRLVVPSGPSGLGRPGYDPHDPLVISAGGSGIKKEGVWTVPPYLSLNGELGSIRLDFRRAQMVSQVTWVQLHGGVGTIVLVLPEGWAAQLDRLTRSWGTVTSKVPEEPIGDNPLLILSGSAVSGFAGCGRLAR
jgi:hypothetical protein